jgi:AbrB family looped-hinge helix DNA binding protein
MKVLCDSKVTDKFQATIPKAARNLLELDSGDRVVFLLEHDHVVVKKGRVEVVV